MKVLNLLVLFIALPLWAATPQFFNINGKKITFSYFKKEHLTLSQSCGKSLKNMSCMAYKQGITASRKGIDKKEFAGGVNPGIVICKAQFNAEIVIASNQYGENAFCKFPDGSMIDAGSLIYYSNK
jgi:putative hemolysin